MKKVIKVSIGKLAFTLEEEGYLLLKGYLDSLSEYYGDKEDGAEIVEGIEERVAELFIEKCGPDSVVSTSVIKEIITILGRPETIFEEEGDIRSLGINKRRRSIPKRLYRDPDNKVLGGVCSGIAAFTGLDTALVRILFFIFFIGFFSFGGGVVALIIYLIMWVLIPQAKTVEQRCSMYGEAMDLSNIHESIKRAGKENASSIQSIFIIFGKIISGIIVFVALISIAALTFVFLGIEVFKGILPLNFIDYVELGVDNTLFMKITFLAVLLLPLLGILWVGLQLLFDLRTPRIRPGIVMLLLWVLSLIGFSVNATKASRPFWTKTQESVEYPIGKHHDTIFIRFEHNNPIPIKRVIMNASYSDFSLMWMDEKSDGADIVVFPSVRIIRQSYNEPSLVRIKSKAHAYSYAEAISKAQENLSQFTLQDSLLTIRSKSFGKRSKWDGTYQNITLFIPNSVEVIVEEPIKHNFRKRVKTRLF